MQQSLLIRMVDLIIWSDHMMCSDCVSWLFVDQVSQSASHAMNQTTSSTTVSLRDLIPRDSDEDNRAALETLALLAIAEDQRKQALEAESHHNPNQQHKKKQTKEDVMLEQLMAHLPQGALGTTTVSFTNPGTNTTLSLSLSLYLSIRIWLLSWWFF